MTVDGHMMIVRKQAFFRRVKQPKLQPPLFWNHSVHLPWTSFLCVGSFVQYVPVAYHDVEKRYEIENDDDLQYTRNFTALVLPSFKMVLTILVVARL